jgi:D-alanine-D-alanine ligase
VSNSTIAVLMGGRSAEREISLQSGAGVLATLEQLGYAAFATDYDDSFVDNLRSRRPDAVFIALHGGAGEDGSVQAVLEWLRIPYQGSGVRASAVAMDKWMTKALMRAEGIPTPPAAIIDSIPAGATLPAIPSNVGYPCVVKPVADGSSVGVHIISESADWEPAIRDAASHGERILVERYVFGREFTVAVLDDAALPVVEIIPNDESYSYAAKYTPGGSTHRVPADLDAASTARMQKLGLDLHRALGARDYSRTDVLLGNDGDIFVLECNTLPGLTQFSLFPEAAAAAGINYAALIERLVKSALRRAAVAN